MNSKKPTSSEEVASNAPEHVLDSGIAPFVYHPAPGWKAAKEAAAASAIVAAGDAVAGVTPVMQAIGEKKEEDALSREKQAWESGFREGLTKGRAENEASIMQQRDALVAAISDFSHERQSYFLHVEAEVVFLALAVVRKILHREAQIDPLLLTGLVRVALEKMSGTQNVRLCVHPSQLRAWQDYFLGRTDVPVVPDCIADTSLDVNQCRIETDHGVTDLHIETQLKEIEQGLFDLLAQRPSPR
ncbi:MAG TPA: FliH/SctL family protein [Candidatus Acidoferrales bacterium]